MKKLIKNLEYLEIKSKRTILKENHIQFDKYE